MKILQYGFLLLAIGTTMFSILNIYRYFNKPKLDYTTAKVRFRMIMPSYNSFRLVFELKNLKKEFTYYMTDKNFMKIFKLIETKPVITLGYSGKSVYSIKTKEKTYLTLEEKLKSDLFHVPMYSILTLFFFYYSGFPFITKIFEKFIHSSPSFTIYQNDLKFAIYGSILFLYLGVSFLLIDISFFKIVGWISGSFGLLGIVVLSYKLYIDLHL